MSATNPKVEIFIVTHARDARYMRHCLRSIEKFASGFSGVTVLVPERDRHVFAPLIATTCGAKLRLGDEPPGKGHLWQCLQKCRADEHCPEADFIFHTDSDCIFREPVSPSDYFHEGLPVLLYESYASLQRQFPGFPWRPVVEAALKQPSHFEFMRRPGMVNPRGLYGMTRNAIAKAHGPVDEYVLSCKPDYPQGFCEFNTLGQIAWHHFHNAYHWINVEREPWPHQKILQLWSHGGLDEEQTVWIDGKQRRVKPQDLIREVLGPE